MKYSLLSITFYSSLSLSLFLKSWRLVVLEVNYSIIGFGFVEPYHFIA